MATLKQAAIDLPEVTRRVSRATRAKRKVADWEGIGCLLFRSEWGGFICRMCFGKVNSRPSKVKTCVGLNTAAIKLVECGKANNHELWVGRQVGGAYAGSPMFICNNCGACASAQCNTRKKPCSRSSGVRRYRHARFMGGRHLRLKDAPLLSLRHV